ncbi:acylphosphatase [Salinarimonas rosea]|uniref:acylphosphatase n=1 Tax=Salinarimonas rosea TaxID=552063 RepID=UPI0004222ACE|nr:acylphosphatase [Salinarimonas rosea]
MGLAQALRRPHLRRVVRPGILSTLRAFARMISGRTREAQVADSAVRIVVTGRVQGVGYRAFAAARAGELALRGFVRNREDGSVESVASGDPAAIEAYLAALRGGPPGASVADLSVDYLDVSEVPESTFAVR